MSTKTSFSLAPLDNMAETHFCQIATINGKRVYTCRTFTACDKIYRLIKNRAMSDAVEIRQGVKNHYVVRHPLPLTIVEDN